MGLQLRQLGRVGDARKDDERMTAVLAKSTRDFAEAHEGLSFASLRTVVPALPTSCLGLASLLAVDANTGSATSD